MNTNYLNTILDIIDTIEDTVSANKRRETENLGNPEILANGRAE